MIITIYDQTSGLIKRTVDCPDFMISIQCGTGEEYIEGDYSGKYYYVNGGAATEKINIPIFIDTFEISADGIDKATISNCPIDAQVFMDNKFIGLVGSDGLVELTSSVPKTIGIKIVLFPYLNWIGVINAS